MRKKWKHLKLPYHSQLPMQNRVETFWSLVDKNGPNGCWIWKGLLTKSKTKPNYGIFSAFAKSHLAHRFSFFLHHGHWPVKPYVCHRCDNPPCVNPDHLFEGTALDNNRDMKEKGRRRNYGRPILAPSQVVRIRALYATGKFTYDTLAVKMKMPRTRIHSALIKWKTLHLYAKA